MCSRLRTEGDRGIIASNGSKCSTDSSKSKRNDSRGEAQRSHRSAERFRRGKNGLWMPCTCFKGLKGGVPQGMTAFISEINSKRLAAEGGACIGGTSVREWRAGDNQKEKRSSR